MSVVTGALREKANKDGGLCFHLEVVIRQDPDGRLFSDHRFQSEKDEQISHSMPAFGVQQIALAMLTEALRCELHVDILVQLGQDALTIERWKQADDAGKRAIEARLAAAAGEVISKSVAKMAPDCARDVLTRMSASPDPQTHGGSTR